MRPHPDPGVPMSEGPLEGRTVVVTRPPRQAASLSKTLRGLGAEPVEFPTIEIRPPRDRTPLLEGLGSLDRRDWLVLTSVNGVQHVLAGLEELGREPREALSGVRVAAIGPSTADALREAGVPVEVVPEVYRAERLVEAMAAATRLDGARVLLARAEEAREVLPRRLRKAGAEVEEVTAYRTAVPRHGSDRLTARLRTGEVDWLTFTASSTARNFVRLAGRKPDRARIAAIGPVTAGTLEDLGLEVDVVAEEYTIPGLVDALVKAETSREGG